MNADVGIRTTRVVNKPCLVSAPRSVDRGVIIEFDDRYALPARSTFASLVPANSFSLKFTNLASRRDGNNCERSQTVDAALLDGNIEAQICFPLCISV